MSNDVPLKNSHRYFIQFMLTNGLVPINKALAFFKKTATDGNSEAHFDIMITEINRAICNQFFKIIKTTCEITGDKVLVWVNLKSDALSLQQVGFSAIDLEYFHAILQEIIGDDHKIVYPRAINISSTLTATLSRENGEKSLKKWISGGYFVKQDEFIYLGPRTLIEFGTYLRANCDYSNCYTCTHLVFVGKACPSCEKLFHTHCIKDCLRTQNNCPNCDHEWDLQLDDTED